MRLALAGALWVAPGAASESKNAAESRAGWRCGPIRSCPGGEPDGGVQPLAPTCSRRQIDSWVRWRRRSRYTAATRAKAIASAATPTWAPVQYR